MSKSSTALQATGWPLGGVLNRFRRVFVTDPAEVVAQQAPIVVIPSEERAFTLETLDVTTLVEHALADVELASTYVRSERAQEHLERATARLRHVVEFLTE